MRKGITMKEKLEKKIDAIIDFIISKPEEKITQEDYNILSSELRDLRFREGQEENNKRMAELMATTFSSGFSGTH